MRENRVNRSMICMENSDSDFEKFEKSLQLVACPLLCVYEAALQELQLGEEKFSNI